MKWKCTYILDLINPLFCKTDFISLWKYDSAQSIDIYLWIIKVLCFSGNLRNYVVVDLLWKMIFAMYVLKNITFTKAGFLGVFFSD